MRAITPRPARTTAKRAAISDGPYAAFLSIPGREWVLFGDFHETISDAQAALAEQIVKTPAATDAWVVSVKAKRHLGAPVIWT